MPINDEINTSEQHIAGMQMLALAEQIRLETPGAKLSEVVDWARDNGIFFGTINPIEKHNRDNGSSAS